MEKWSQDGGMQSCTCKHLLISLLSSCWNSAGSKAFLDKEVNYSCAAEASPSGSAGCDTGRFVCVIPVFVVNVGSLVASGDQNTLLFIK